MISTLFAVMSVLTTTLFGGSVRTDIACQPCQEDDLFDGEDDAALPDWLRERVDVADAIERVRRQA